jgi:NDP-sugar pyrophosphorylase family protein
MVSMGIYVFEPRVLEFIPRNAYLDFPDLVKRLIAAGEIVTGYVVRRLLARPGPGRRLRAGGRGLRPAAGDFLPPERPAVFSVNGSGGSHLAVGG